MARKRYSRRRSSSNGLNFGKILGLGFHGTFNYMKKQRDTKIHKKKVASAKKASSRRKLWSNLKTFFKR